MTVRTHWIIPGAVLAAMALSGCMTFQSQRDAAKAQEAKTTKALNEARNEIKRLTDQLTRQDEQLLSLLALGPKRLDKLYHVQSIVLGENTAPIATDGRDSPNAVKVYLLPMDQDNSILKAAGDVKIQLFDLSAPPEDNLIGECAFGVDEVSKHWTSGSLAYHYSFVCPWKEGILPHEDLTVRVEFIDYLTGRHLTALKVVKVAPPPAGQPAGSRAK